MENDMNWTFGPWPDVSTNAPNPLTGTVMCLRSFAPCCTNVRLALNTFDTFIGTKRRNHDFSMRKYIDRC